MKKVAAGFLILLSVALSGCGNDVPNKPAETKEYGDEWIAETMKVPKHYTFQNESDSGISKVLVDADIFVPEVYGVDILEAVPVVFSEEQIRTFIKQHEDDGEWHDAYTDALYAGEGFTKEDLTEEHIGIQSYSMLLNNKEEFFDKGGPYREISVSFWLNKKTGAIAFTPTLEYANSVKDPAISELIPLNEQNMANDCTIRLEEAIHFANEEADLLSPDFALSQYGQLDQKLGTGNVIGSQYYGFRYTRSIHGIPVNPDINRVVGDGSAYTSGTECVWMTVKDDGVCWLYYCNPTQPGEVVAENVELLPFQDIMDIFEKVSMLSIKHLELYDNLVENIMDIREIRFGYMAVKQPESVGGYRYIPVWDFYGLHYPVYENNQYYPEAYDEPVFTVNAMDGTVIDRWLGY